MNYMVIVNNLQVGDAVLSAQDIVVTLLKHEKWLFSSNDLRVGSEANRGRQPKKRRVSR